ncbi:MAG: ATP-binding domain-containing protein, partial [Clostridium sp.]
FEQYSKTFLPANFKYESKNDHLDYIYSKCEDKKAFTARAKSMEYKNTKAFMDVLNKFVPQISELITDFKPIIIDDKQIVSKKNVAKTFLERFSDIPFLNRIEVVKQSLFSQVETKYLSSDDNSHFDYVEDKRDFYDYCKQQVDIQVDSMIKTLNHVEIYKILWENIKKYTSQDLSSIKEITLEYLNCGEVKYEDITPIIYIRASMEGFRNYSNVKHMLIDEAQDYSPLFYEIIKRSFKNASITIMGDLNQRIDKHSNVKNKEDILSVFENIKTVALTKCYRSTANITNFTKEILDTHEPIEAVERIGENPTIYITKPTTKADAIGLDIIDETLESNITNTINEMKAKSYTSIAVICKNKSTCRLVYNALKEKDSSVNIIDSDTSEFKLGINVISSYLAKGLEFDGVIVVDGENYLYDLDKNLFYTVCTRALHELHVFSNKDLSPILPNDKGLYTLITK